MAVQDIQAGAGYLHGIAGTITITPTGGSDVAGAMNIGSRNLTHNFTLDELASQDGTIIEAAIATKEYRDLKVEFMPRSTTRALAEAVVDTFVALPPLKVLAFAASTVSAYNGDFNYMAGLDVGETREGRVVLSFNARQYKKADGTFGGLALITG